MELHYVGISAAFDPYAQARPVGRCAECGAALYDGDRVYYGRGTDHVLGWRQCIDAGFARRNREEAMLEGGFILLHRSILRWEWYGDLNTARLFIHLLLTVNYEPQRWQGIAVERGQRVASMAKLADETGLTVKQVRTALEHLKRTGEVTHTATSKYGLFTVNHYDRYQPRGEPEGTRPGMENGIQGAGGGRQRAAMEERTKKQRKRAKRPRPRRGRNGPAAKCRRNARGAPAERGRNRTAALCGRNVRAGRTPARVRLRQSGRRGRTKQNSVNLKTCCSTGGSMGSWWTAWAIPAHRNTSSVCPSILHRPGGATKATTPRF